MANRELFQLDTETTADSTWVTDIQKADGSIEAQKSSLATLKSLILGYKSYEAAITQNGTGAPTVSIFNNTIGNIIWSRTSTGNYIGTLVGAFPSTKTPTIMNVFLYVSPNSYQYSIQRNASDDSIVLNSFTGSTLTDSVLSSTFIEIRVYN